MTFRDLEYLVAVADHGHFGRAAESCHATQSTLSLQLQKLEAELGVQLVERTNRRVVVTPTGQLLVERARQILRSRQELLDDAAIESGQMPREITLGMIPTIAPYLLHRVLPAMRREHPGTRVRIMEDVTTALERGVAQGELDAAIIATPVTDTLLEDAALMEDELLLAVPESHEWALRRRRLNPAAMEGDRLLLLKDGHCLKDQVLGYCSAQGAVSGHESVAASIATLMELIRQGEGVTLVPRMAVDSMGAAPGVAFLKLDPTPSRTVRLITRKTSRLGRFLTATLTKRGSNIPHKR